MISKSIIKSFLAMCFYRLCSESWYCKLEFCFTSLAFCYHRLWSSSWYAMLALFSLYVFMVWIFKWCDLFQVTGTNVSWVLYITCSQFITFEQVTLYSSYCMWFAASLASSFVVFLRTCSYFFWLTLIVQFTSEFILSCADLCKVSTEDGDHVISEMMVLIAEIESNCSYIVLSILIVWLRCDLFNVSL